MELSLYFAAKYPDVQQRVYTELAVHYDKYKGFEIKRMNELHIFRAFVYESLRFGSPVKLTLKRDIIDEYGLKLGGYHLPKGTTLLGGTYAIHTNDKYWSKPNEFYVEHFLDDQDRFKKSEYFSLFGYGRRNCVGQSFAIKELFAVLSGILYRYKFSVPMNRKDTFEVPEDFFANDPKQLPLIIERRNE